MTIDHLPPDPFQKFTWQTFGFITTAEGFVLLSGLVSGMVYGRMAIEQGYAVAARRIRKRAITIFLANACLITAGILAAQKGLAFLGDGFQPGWSLWIKTLLCLESPGHSEILRMYLVFLLFLPFVIGALVKGRFPYVAAISIALWLAASRGYGMTAFPNLGYFDIVSWQLVFLGGVYFGFQAIRPEGLSIPRSVVAVSYPVVLVFFVARHWHVLTGQNWSPYIAWLADRRHTLPLLRLVDFAAFSILVYRFRRPLNKLVMTPMARAVAFLGQHSLQVFVWSVLVGMVMAEAVRRWPEATKVDEAAITIAIVVSCFIPARLHQEWQRFTRGVYGVRSAGFPASPLAEKSTS